MIKNIDRAVIKIICVMAAVATWLYVMTTINPEITRSMDNIPLDTENEEVLIEEGYYLYEQDKNNISVLVKGRRNEILGLEKKDIMAKIDVADYSEGNVKIPVEIILPENVEMVNYEPKQIACTIEKFISRSVDVEVRKEGKSAEGFYLAEPQLNFSSVIVSGPETLVESISKAVVILDVNDAEENIVKNLPVNLYNYENVVVELPAKPSVIRVSTNVYPIKRVEVKVPLNGDVGEGYIVDNIVVNPSEIEIYGSQSDIDNIKSVVAEPLEITGKTAVFTQKVKLIKENFHSDTDEIQITVIVEKIIQKEFTYDITDIKFINEADGYIVDKESENRQITLRISGSESKIKNTQKEDITLEIDLQNTLEENFIGNVNYRTDIPYENIELSVDKFAVRMIHEENNIN